jgi:hypothetical protein
MGLCLATGWLTKAFYCVCCILPGVLFQSFDHSPNVLQTSVGGIMEPPAFHFFLKLE